MRTPSHLDRYRTGEHTEVWAELIALGPAVRQEPLLSDALAVARETMHRVRENIEQLIPRLEHTHYQFAALVEKDEEDDYPSAILIPPPSNIQNHLAAIEQAVGPIPLSLYAWYETVGLVNFMGVHPQWNSTICSDPLVFDCDTEWVLPSYQDWKADTTIFDAHGFRIDFAPDLYHKAEYSGGAPYAIALPNAAIDAPVLYEWHTTTFVNYLRTCFRWGGFPGFEQYPEHERPTELLAFLAHDLLPI
jgi:hypothetical protein